MRKKMPTMTESADALPQRMTQAKAPQKRQRLQALSLAARGRAPHRQELAALLSVPRPRVAAWLEAAAAGGLDPMRHSQVPRPPRRQRLTATAWPALQAKLRAPHGLAG